MAHNTLTAAQLRLVAQRFKALAEPSRLEILNALRRGERTVTEIQESTKLGQANVSRHLQVLYGAGFVDRRKDGVTARYRLADPDVFQLCDLVCGRLEQEALARRKLFG